MKNVILAPPVSGPPIPAPGPSGPSASVPGLSSAPGLPAPAPGGPLPATGRLPPTTGRLPIPGGLTPGGGNSSAPALPPCPPAGSISICIFKEVRPFFLIIPFPKSCSWPEFWLKMLLVAAFWPKIKYYTNKVENY